MKTFLNRMSNFSYRCALPWLLLTALLLGFSACAAGRAPSAAESEHASDTANTVFSPVTIDLPLDEGEVLLDVLPGAEGYRLLVGQPDNDPSHRYIIFDFGDALYRAYTSELRTYDAALNELDRTVTDGAYTCSMIETPSGVFSFVTDELFRPQALAALQADDPENTEDKTVEDFPIQWGISNLYLDGSAHTSLQVMTGTNTTCSVLVSGNDVYCLIDGTYTEDMQNKLLLINGQAVRLPSLFLPAGPETFVRGIVALNGTVYAVLQESKYDYAASDSKTPLWEKTELVPLSPGTKAITAGDGPTLEAHPTGPCASLNDRMYFTDGTLLYTSDGRSATLLTDLALCGCSPNSTVRRLLPLEDGRVLLIVDGKLIECGEHPAESAQKQLITLGVLQTTTDYEMTDNSYEYAVRRYNAQSSQYAVTIRYFKTRTALNLALLSNEVALVICDDQMALRSYAAQQRLLPLEQAAPALLEGALLPNVCDAAMVGGSHYYLPRYFTLRGFRLPESVMGDRTAFASPGELFAFLEQCQATDRMASLSQMAFFKCFLADLDDWIDWETGQTRFTDGDFAEILAFCAEHCSRSAAAALDFDEANASSSLPLLSPIEIIGRVDGGYLFHFDPEAMTPFPIPGARHTGFQIYAPWLIGIVNDPETQAAASDFLQFFFLEDIPEYIFNGQEMRKWGEMHQLAWNYPINKAECEVYLRCYYDTCVDLYTESGLLETYSTSLSMYKKEIEETWRMINSADHLNYSYGELFDAICEEAARCFSGQTTAEQAAAYTQNRVQLFLAEQQ